MNHTGYDPLLFGSDATAGIVAVEFRDAARGEPCRAVVFRRDQYGRSVPEEVPFAPFMIVAERFLGGCPVSFEMDRMDGGELLDTVVFFRSWKDWTKAKAYFARVSSIPASSPEAPYLCINDPVQQYLMFSGRTLFKGLEFHDLRRMQVDIECLAAEGYEFCNPDREGDRIIAIAMGFGDRPPEVIPGTGMDERDMLERFVAKVMEYDPDVIEGHNIFNFDLDYIRRRAKLLGVGLGIGRDGSAPSHRPGRFSIAERNIAYERFDIAGRHIVDTMFLLHAYDVSHRSLEGFGLKAAARHFGIAPPDRTYIEGSAISREFIENPDRLMQYAGDDIIETRALSSLLSRSYFEQVRMLPYSYQNVCVKGNATRIEALMLREYIRRRHSLPIPGKASDFEGGYTDIFARGVIRNVHHCDIRSLYPSLMLARNISPARDSLGVFPGLLAMLKEMRVAAKERAVSEHGEKRIHYDALQSTFKILINSFYGYLGFGQGRFCDFNAAARVTAEGRELLSKMIRWLEEHGARPVEIDTDGIYFVPPPDVNDGASRDFRKAMADFLPPGIDIEFDGEYVSMFSYRMKNYALLTGDGEVIIKGAALKSRGLESFQRLFIKEALKLLLEGKGDEIDGLRARYGNAIRNREWHVSKLAKTETLQESPETYMAKRAKGRARNAAYELALASGRKYRAGDQISYYVTGSRKTVPVHENARLVSDWKQDDRDENIEYYLAKLDDLCEKFALDVPGNGDLPAEQYLL